MYQRCANVRERDDHVALNEDLILIPDIQAILLNIIITELYERTRVESKQTSDEIAENDKLRDLFCQIIDNVTDSTDILRPFTWFKLGIISHLSIEQLEKIIIVCDKTGSAEDLRCSDLAEYLIKKMKSK